MQCCGDRKLWGAEGAPWRSCPWKEISLNVCSVEGKVTGDQDHLLPRARRHGWRPAPTLPNVGFLPFGDLGNIPSSKAQFLGSSWDGQEESPVPGYNTAESVH